MGVISFNKDDKKKDAGKKTPADAGSVTVVLKLDLDCDGCAKKVTKSIRHFEGVESVNADIHGNKLTVTGKVDPTRVKERVEHKTKKNVEIISPQAEKDDKKVGDKSPPEKKSDEKKIDDKKTQRDSIEQSDAEDSTSLSKDVHVKLNQVYQRSFSITLSQS